MPKTPLLLLLTGLLLCTAAVADKSINSCSRFPEVARSGRDQCDCSNDLTHRYPVTDRDGHWILTAPTGMRLVAVCNYSMKKNGDPYGDCFYRGKVRAAGVVWSGEDVAASDLNFEGKEPFNGVWLSGDKETRRRFGMPRNPDLHCSREVTLFVSKFAQTAGADTDQDRPYILEFDIVRIAKSRECALK